MAKRPRDPFQVQNPHASSQKVQTRFKQPRRRIYLREWRKFRGLTQEELAERVGWSVGNVSQLETGQQGYSDEGLAMLAEELNCTPGQILDVDPTDDKAIWSLWERAKPAQRQTILEVARSFVIKTGTGG
jgi:DNA-binding Xre family transcriptional regulator